MVSTAKEGLLTKQSTIIFEGDPVCDKLDFRACGKIIYVRVLSRKERLRFHDILVDRLSQLGDDGIHLHEALAAVLSDFESDGIASETVNLADNFEVLSSKDEDAEINWKTILAEADFESASFEIRRMMTMLVKEGDAQEGAYYLKAEVHNALAHFVQTPSLSTAVELLDTAPEFAPFFDIELE